MSKPNTLASRTSATKRKRRLTTIEKRVLLRSAELVLAGEWPWGEENMAREIVALRRAADKLKGDTNG